MDITPIIPQGKKVISAYGDGGFKVNGDTAYQGSIIVCPGEVIPVTFDTIEKLTPDTLTPLYHQQPALELLLVGTGKSIAPFPIDIRTALRSKGIVVELMDTGAACRTYNILLSEERRVAALLIAV